MNYNIAKISVLHFAFFRLPSVGSLDVGTSRSGYTRTKLPSYRPGYELTLHANSTRQLFTVSSKFKVTLDEGRPRRSLRSWRYG